MELMIIITVTSLALSIVITVVTSKFAGAKKDEFQRAAILTLCTAILFNILFQRYEVDKLAEPINIAAKALSEEKINSILVAFKDSQEKFADKSNDVMLNALKLRFSEFEEAITEVNRTGVLAVRLTDLEPVALNIVQSANNSIKATSYVDSSEWWKKPWGRRYFNLNAREIQDGVEIDRIFIFENEEALKKDNDLLVCNAMIGVNVHVLLLSDLSRPLGEDVIIVDENVVAGQLVFNPHKSIVASNFSASFEFIKKRHDTYETALFNSTEYVMPENPICPYYTMSNFNKEENNDA
ncbi:hypothetical protein [Pseudoalteromonas sp. A757]|uniref:hypothetical protein n=1 Tax=Pseudoalteromonas sp. A757 TaxID=2250709 RepID=UPI000FFF1143|nr:hypothetical protein [Pseudoalteromonas sp. A757]RXE87927.1 hypothetical protein DRB05_05710 [Pseudoalteromonas sp. A757]